jgi:hypothetical protein
MVCSAMVKDSSKSISCDIAPLEIHGELEIIVAGPLRRPRNSLHDFWSGGINHEKTSAYAPASMILDFEVSIATYCMVTIKMTARGRDNNETSDDCEMKRVKEGQENRICGIRQASSSRNHHEITS